MPERLNRRHRGGFTLIELLVVIGIILLLMSILIPVAGHIRNRGYEVRTKALIQKITAGCHAYYNDFNAYPGLMDDSQLADVTKLPGGILMVDGSPAQLTPSENLVLSLVGGVGYQGASRVYDAKLLNTGPQSLNPNYPKQYQAYVEVAPGELSAGFYGDPSNTVKDSNVPEFVDSFPQQLPIVYVRARGGRLGIVNDGSDPIGSLNGGLDAQFQLEQIASYASNSGLLRNTGFGLKKTYKSWADYLRNPGLTPLDPATGSIPNGVVEVPRGRDSFLLISAGVDRQWYSGDDLFSAD